MPWGRTSEQPILLRTFRWAFAVTALGLATGVLYEGWTDLGHRGDSPVLEVSLSCDNAVINAETQEQRREHQATQRTRTGPTRGVALVGRAAFFMILYLEVWTRPSPSTA